MSFLRNKSSPAFFADASPPSDLNHLTKRRTSAPGKRPPSQYKHYVDGNKDRRRETYPSGSSDDLSDHVETGSTNSAISVDSKHLSHRSKSSSGLHSSTDVTSSHGRSKYHLPNSSPKPQSKHDIRSKASSPVATSRTRKSGDTQPKTPGSTSGSSPRLDSKGKRSSLELLSEQLDIRVEGAPIDESYLTVSGFQDDEDEIMV